MRASVSLPSALLVRCADSREAHQLMTFLVSLRVSFAAYKAFLCAKRAGSGCGVGEKQRRSSVVVVRRAVGAATGRAARAGRAEAAVRAPRGRAVRADGRRRAAPGARLHRGEPELAQRARGCGGHPGSESGCAKWRAGRRDGTRRYCCNGADAVQSNRAPGVQAPKKLY